MDGLHKVQDVCEDFEEDFGQHAWLQSKGWDSSDFVKPSQRN